MRTVPAALLAHLRTATTSVAFCWKIIPVVGAVEGYTSLDVDLTISGVLYSAAANVLPSAVPASLGLKSDALDVTTLTDQIVGLVSAQKLLTGYYEQAQYEIFIVNYKGNLSERCVLSAGRLGRGGLKDDVVSFELKPWGNLLGDNIGYNVLPTCQCPRFGRKSPGAGCRNEIFDGGLGDGVFIEDHTISGVIGTVFSKTHFLVSGISQGAGWATAGYLRWTNVASANYQPDSELTGHRVKKWEVYSGGALREVRLNNAPPFMPVAGEAVAVEEGCLRTVDACKTKLCNNGTTGNVRNMRMAFPYLPGANIVNKKQN